MQDDLTKIGRTMDRVNEKVTDIKTKDKPELLAPCGSIDVLRAALSAGADAVYFGGQKFNARANAVNFTEDEIKAGLDLCHANGVKGYVTLNTVYYGSELTELLKYCEFLYNVGTDALIVTDLGAVSLIKKYFPDFELHASTQCTGHNIYAAKKLKELGFS